MKQFCVPYTNYVTVDIIVDAENEDEAIKKAKIKLDSNKEIIYKAISNVVISDDISVEGGEDYDLLNNEIFEIFEIEN